jgi:hypothetical protein
MGRFDQIWRSRWAAVGAAVAITLGAGGLVRTAGATIGSGDRAVFVPITPCRLFDTRPAPDNVGPRTAPLTAGDTFTVPVRGSNGNCVIPAGATGVAMNVTIVNPTGFSYLTIYPGDASRPLSSNLNWTPSSSPTPNQVTVKLGESLGDIKVYNLAGSVDVLADIVGYFEPHNHDDAYYTKAQVDTMLAAAKDDVWAYVISNGGIHAGSGNFTVTHPATGVYCVVVSKRSSHKAAQATLANPDGNYIVSVGTGHGSLCNPLSDATHDAIPVYVVTTADVAVDANFTIVVPAP